MVVAVLYAFPKDRFTPTAARIATLSFGAIMRVKPQFQSLLAVETL